jgi:hypothetical protein
MFINKSRLKYFKQKINKTKTVISQNDIKFKKQIESLKSKAKLKKKVKMYKRVIK